MAYSQPPPAQAPYGPPPQGQTPYSAPPPGWPPAGPPPHTSPPSGAVNRDDTEGLALLAIAIIGLVFGNLYWLYADNHLIHLDEAHHMGRAAAYHDALFPTDGDTEFFGRALAALAVESPYPPLTHVAGAAAIRLFGYSPDTLALTGTAAFVLLLLGVYLLARQGMAARNAFLTACVTGLTPMIYAGSRYFMPDTLLCAITVWALFTLVKADRFRNTGWVMAFGLLAGLALLTRQTAFVYLLPPAIIVIGWGMLSALSAAQDAAPSRRRRFGRIAFNTAMCICIVLGVCSWWYVRHVEYLHVWWGTQRGGDTGILQPGIAALVEPVMPQVTESPGTRIALDPSISISPEATRETPAHPSDTSLWTPFRLHGEVYPLYMVNEVAFLPLVFVALAGLLATPLKRNRTLLTLLLLAWLCGAWLLLTGLFNLRSPRFLYAAAPPLAFFCVMALDAIGPMRLRRAAWCALFVILGITYVNLSFFPLGPIRRIEVPLLTDHPAVTGRGNRGLTVYKDTVDTGHYQLHAPHRGENITETLFTRMIVYEQERRRYHGPVAWYQVVASAPARLGLPYYAHRHAPPAHEENSASRPFAAVKWESRQPEDTLPELAETEYLVLKPDMEGDYIARLEAWVAFFKPYGFESILNTRFDGYGRATPGYVHVMARKDIAPLDEVRNLFDLYDLLERDGQDWLLSDEERMEAEQRYAQQVRQYGDGQPIGGGASLLGFHVEQQAEDWFVLRFIIHVREPNPDPLRMWVRARFQEEDQPQLLTPHQEMQAIVWDFDPMPPAGQWQQNQALVLSRPVMARPLSYQLDIGLYDPGRQAAPSVIVTTEQVDFAAPPL